jgi:hypothetical protein
MPEAQTLQCGSQERSEDESSMYEVYAVFAVAACLVPIGEGGLHRFQSELDFDN